MKLHCIDCGLPFEAEVSGSVNVREHPELKEKVLDGSLFMETCPHCGRVNLLGQALLYNDPDQKILMWLLPEENGTRNVEASIKAAIAGSDPALLEGYTTRIVRTAGDLMEKVKIFDSGLDDLVMELCKHVTKLELAGDEKDKARLQAISKAPFKFFRLDGPDNDIEFTYPLDGRMVGARVGFNVYEDCAGIVSRNPSMRPSDPFQVIDSVWVGRFIG
ncbi:MAG: CpXC domain-containing protein [Bacteroidales bacterium]|nr:CpXC domain-containing protein [Bacteroidales bacterium]